MRIFGMEFNVVPDHWEITNDVAPEPYLQRKMPDGVMVTIERVLGHSAGNWCAKLTDEKQFWALARDGFPRFYFEVKVAISEMDAYIERREAR